MLTCLLSGVVLYVLQFVAVFHLIFITFCLCMTVRSAIIFNYVPEFQGAVFW